MNYEELVAYSKHCSQIWNKFKASFRSEATQSFLKKSYPVLSCPSGQIPLSDVNLSFIGASSPGSLVPGKDASRLIKKAAEYIHLVKKSDAADRNELKKMEKWLQDFNPQHLKFHSHRLEVRFPALKMALIQEIKNSPYVDSQFTGRSQTSIRVVLKT